MTRSQSAYLRAVKASLVKLGKPDHFDPIEAMRLYDAWVKAPAAARQLASADTLRYGICTPVSIDIAAKLLAST